MINFKGRWLRLRGHLVHLLESPTDELGRLGRMAVYQIRLWKFCGRQLVQDRLLTVAGDLTFKTLLGLIPALLIFLLVISFFSRGSEVGQEVQDALFRALNITGIRVQEDGEEVELADKVGALVETARVRMNHAAVTGMGILFLLAMEVLATFEAAANDIWRIRGRRPWWKRLVLFWLVLVVAPVLAGGVVYVSKSISDSLSVPVGWSAAGRVVAGLVATWFVLAVIYKMLPNTKVRFRAALTGALVAGTLWHVLARMAFGYYLRYSVGYGQIYGTLAVVPLFFLWIWVTWVFVLFGCELAGVVQNYADLARAEALERQRRLGGWPAPDFAALVALAICARRFRDGAGPTPLNVLVEGTGLEHRGLQELLGRLEAAGLVARTPPPSALPAEVAFLPARDPGRITAADVMAAARGALAAPIDPAHLPLYREVLAAYERVEGKRNAEAGHITLADLAGPEGGPPDPVRGRPDHGLSPGRREA